VRKEIFLFVDGLLKEDVIMLNLYPDLKQEEMEGSKREFIFGKMWFNLVQRFHRRRLKCDLLSKYA
jgi:predicted RNA-binding protein with PUA domain